MSFNQVSEHMTNAVAAGAVVSPIWLPFLRDASQFAGILVPILGAVWLIVQIAHKVKNWEDDS